MKLLSWMRTIKQNGVDPSKEFKGGFGCLRAQVLSDVQDIRTNSFSFSGPSHPPKVEELRFDEDGFCGFLAIGTLGTDPETPKFSAMVTDQDVTGEKKEMAKLITEKLDKFLKEYPHEDTSNKQVERSNRDLHACPLQDYDLFRSSIELTKRSNGRVKKKKNLLTSLFKRRQTVQEGEPYIEKHGTRDAIKWLFKKLYVASSKTRNDDDDSTPKKKKDLRKNAQIYRSKVHPVLYTPARDDNEIDDRRKLDLKVSKLTGGFRFKFHLGCKHEKRKLDQDRHRVSCSGAVKINTQ